MIDKRMTHGMTKTPEYEAWRSMKVRCSCPRKANYDRYGGRGISVCHEWETSFEEFYKSMGLRPSPEHSLDRIDNDGNYTPDNCRWATREEQARNKRRSGSHMITYAGRTMYLAEWAREKGLSYNALHDRLVRYRWPIEKALTRPSGWRPRTYKSKKKK